MVDYSGRAGDDEIPTVNGLMAKESELPRIKVRIAGLDITALVDSGSAATLMSASVWANRLGRPDLNTEGSYQLRSVTGGVLNNRGQLEASITVGSATTTLTTHVIEGLPYDLLLGIDFIRSSRMVLNAAEGYVQVGASCIPFASSCRLYNGPRVVSLPRAVKIEAEHVTAIAIDIETLGNKDEERLVEFNPISPEETPFPQLEVLGVVAETNSSGKILITVVNPSEGAVTLPSGYVLGQSTLCEGLVAAVQIPHSQKENGESGSNPWAGRWGDRRTFLEQFPLDHLSGETRAKVERLLCKYESIFASHEYDLGRIQIAAHTIRLKPGAEPVHARPYPCSESQRQELRRQLEEMLRHDLIEPAYDGFTSPCLLVKKPNASSETDSWRLCQSFVKLNSVTETLSYPLPNMQRLLEELGRNRGFVSSMDMAKSFYQIRVLPECAKLAGFTTPFGTYAPKVLLMGLKNSSQSLQRVVDAVYAPLLATGKVHCYLDDLICSTTGEEEHLEMLEAVFQRAKQHDVRYKPSKTKLLCRSIKLLGHHISPQGISVDDSKTRAISDIAEPTNKTEVRAYIGLATFYKRFIRGYAGLVRPLLDLLKKNAPFVFTQECRNSFETLKRCLCESPVLRYPDFSGKYPFHVYTDASSRALGAALHQEFEDGSHPVAFASRVLTPSELPQPILVKESLAVVFAICEKFFYYLDGRHFILTTDNSALRYLLQATREPKGSSRLVRDAMRLLDFDFEVRHRPGPEIPHVDGISRLTWRDMRRNTEPKVDIDLDDRERPVCAVVDVGLRSYTGPEIRSEQLRDERLGDIIRHMEEGTQRNGPQRYKHYVINKLGVLQKLDKVNGRALTVVPRSLQNQLLSESHEGQFGGHVGAKKMVLALRSRFAWRGMGSDAQAHVRNCAVCESRSAGFLGRAPIQENYQASYPFQKVSIDFLTGLPLTDRGNSVMLTAVDCFTRWVELVPLPTRSAKEVALALRDRIFFRHGMCDLVSDNGAEFVSQIVTELYSLLGVRASTCTTYHPQAQGKVERTHRVIADMLAKYVSSGEPHWDLYAAACQFAINNSVHSATKHTPYYLLHGRAAQMPSDILMSVKETVQWPDYHEYVELLLRNTHKAFAEVRESVDKARKANQIRVNDKARLRKLSVGDDVLLHVPHTKPGQKAKLVSRWKSGYKVIDKFGQVNYYVENQTTNQRQLVHIDRLKLRRSSSGKVKMCPQNGKASTALAGRSSPLPGSDGEGWFDADAALPARQVTSDVSLAKSREPVGRQRSDPSQEQGGVEARKEEGMLARDSNETADKLSASSPTESTTPEPASDSDSDSGTDDSRAVGSSGGAVTEGGTSAEEELGERHTYARLTDSRRYPSRVRHAPDRYSP